MPKRTERKRMGARARRKAENAENKGNSSYLNLPEGVVFYKPKKGTRAIDILPYEVTVNNNPEVDKGDLWYQRTIYVHFNVGIEEKAILCPRTVGKKCPICEYIAQLKKDPEADEDLIKTIKPKERELFNVIDLDADSDKVCLFEFSYYCFGEKLDEEIREGKPEYGDFAELEDGYSLNVRFKEESLGSIKYLKASRIDFEKRDDYDESILDDVLNLDEILSVLSYDAIEKILHGIPEEAIEEDSKEEVVKPKKKSTRKRKAKVEEPEEDDSEEDETEEEAPKKKSTRKRKAKVEEPEEAIEEDSEEEVIEDEPEDDSEEDETEVDEEPEPPKKKSKKGKCPYGYKFGVDVDLEKECEDCDIWETCIDEYEANKKSKRK